jgi:uncharacterized protein (UPF0332 family)
VTLPEELLDTARYLLRRNQNRPTQADLRRAVSTAYYAVFHLLVGDAVGAMTADPAERVELARAFEHRDMRKACQGVLTPPAPSPLPILLGPSVAAELTAVATAFVRLQDERHRADYDLARTFTRQAAREIVGQAAEAFAEWNIVRATSGAQAFLALLFFGLKAVKTR